MADLEDLDGITFKRTATGNEFRVSVAGPDRVSAHPANGQRPHYIDDVDSLLRDLRYGNIYIVDRDEWQIALEVLAGED